MAFSQDILKKVKEALIEQLVESTIDRGIKTWTVNAAVDDAGFTYVELFVDLILPKGSATVKMRFDMDEFDYFMKEST